MLHSRTHPKPKVTVCVIEACGRPTACRGWCTKHYARWYRHGDPLATKVAIVVRDDERRCARCKNWKPLVEYRKGQSYCRPCHVITVSEWKKRNPEKVRVQRDRSNIRRYGATEAIFDGHDGRCEICGRTERLDRRLCIDHDHQTGIVRGLLCNDCNTGIARFGDDIDVLRQAITYLERGQRRVSA